MRTIFSTRSAFERAYSPGVMKGLSSMPMRMWPPRLMAVDSTFHWCSGSITEVFQMKFSGQWSAM